MKASPDLCDLCGREFIRVDGGRGNGNEDSLMINDYLTMTEWYKLHKSDEFKIREPNPYACRKCVQLLIDAGLEMFIGGDAKKFLVMQEWWR